MNAADNRPGVGCHLVSSKLLRQIRCHLMSLNNEKPSESWLNKELSEGFLLLSLN